jgi:hypothetical protein
LLEDGLEEGLERATLSGNWPGTYGFLPPFEIVQTFMVEDPIQG